MRFTTAGVDDAVQTITDTLSTLLGDDKKILWLTSGGSAIAPQVSVMRRLQDSIPDKLGAFTVLPVDERYGLKDHEHSNTAQMRRTGFEPGAAKWHDVLARNLPMAETVSYYAGLAEDAFAEADVVVATLGMGPDAHTAGLLPGSPAVTDTVSTVVGYSWSDYERLTLGISALLKIDTAWVLAYGETKKEALERLQKNEEAVEALPAKILYDLPDVTVYNDYINT